MSQRGEGPDLGPDPAAVVVVGVASAEHLDRDPAPEHLVGGGEHVGHPASPHQAVEPVALGDQVERAR